MSEVDSYLDSVNEELKPFVIELRKAITSVSKDLKEEIKWNVPTYSVNKNACSITAHKGHVNLQVFQGAQVKDSALIEGSGKSMRHLKYKEPGDVKASIVEKIVRQAIEIDG